ncbi:MAG: hypothetical protein E7347_03305 [Clostridiales bacterium]|nr:hypothetical protein [Clostridiales bacterium]
MAFEPVFEKISFNCVKKSVSEQIKAECKVEIPIEEISHVINVSAWAVISESSLENGVAEYGGKAVFYVSYADSEGVLRKCERGVEFKGNLKDAEIKTTDRAYFTVSVDKTEYDLNGSKLTVSAYLTVRAKLDGCESVNALSGGENLVVNQNEIQSVKSFGVKSTVFPLEEEFELSYPVAEVLSHRAQAVITAVQCGVGAIIVDGEVLLSAIMLQKNEKSDIIKEIKTMPFRAEIECEEAMPNMQATARVREKSFKTDVAVDEDSGKSVVSAQVYLLFEGEAYSDQTLTVATDVFSTEQEVELIKHDLEYYKTGELRCCTQAVSGKAVTPDLPAGTTLLAVGGENVEIVSKRCDGEKTAVTGVINAVIYLRDSEQKVSTVKVETPFECNIDCPMGCDVEIDLVARAQKARARIISVNEIELETEIAFTVYPHEKSQIKIIGEIKALGEKKKNSCALSVYIPVEGEELWSLSKRLNVCPSALLSTNPELTFPLTGKERIVVYRQK